MAELIYVLRFTGRAASSASDGNVLNVVSTAPSSSVTTTVGPNGLASALRPHEGGDASFASEVTFTGRTSFQETGTIAFGDRHRLRFSTVGSGYLDRSADPTRQHGTVMWRIDGGDGQFAGASGHIISNFLVGEDLTVTDHHVGVIFLA